MIGIYYIENPKGKIYIGSTIDFNRRRKEYKQGKCKDQNKIYNSIMKYGWDKHKFVEFVYCSEETLRETEQKLLDFFKPELNTSLSATGGKVYDIHPFLGKRGDKHHGSKKVYQFDLDGNFIAEHDSVRLAADNTGLDFSHISKCCRGKAKKHGGYVWRYERGR